MQFCILDSNAYKIIVGVDLLNKLEFIYDGPGRRLHLSSQGVKFSLPLATKDYAFNAPAVKAYREAASLVSNTTAAEVDVNMNDETVDSYDLPEALADGEEALYNNALSWSCREYINHQEGLDPVLYRAELHCRTDSEEDSAISENFSENSETP